MDTFSATVALVVLLLLAPHMMLWWKLLYPLLDTFELPRQRGFVTVIDKEIFRPAPGSADARSTRVLTVRTDWNETVSIEVSKFTYIDATPGLLMPADVAKGRFSGKRMILAVYASYIV